MTRIASVALLGMAALAAVPLAAQGQGYAQEVVQALPNSAQLRLNEALRALSRDPRSVPALVAAGQASIGLDDVDAALGFFRRAEAVSPADGGVKAGLAAVAARQGRPLEALRLFAEAEAAGEPMQGHAAERGLAYDLAGDNVHAQQEYAAALSVGDDPGVARRLALSQAIAGDQRASEATLLPMLQHRDLAAFRTRAFALAILGKSDEAVSIAETMLPEQLSSRIAPYLRYMPRLTRAQQAAAANLGVFPRAAEIGRDDPAIAAYAAQAPPAQPVRTADSRLVPSGVPLGQRERARGGVPRRERAAAPERVYASAGPAPAVQAPPPAVETAPPPRVVPAPPPVAEPALTPVPEPAPPPAVVVVATPSPAPAESGPPAVVLAAVPQTVADADTPVAASPADEPPAAEPAVEVDIVGAFSDFAQPSSAYAPAEGAVDITKIQPRREAPRPPPAPARPVSPSREWVQVATGRDLAALEFDWRRIKRNAGGLLDRYKPYVAAWGQTNRLVAGPFASAREAQEFVGKLKDKQLDSFRFTSAQGEEVKPLE
jgi:Flp pilus assembly protein TadD